MWRVSASLRGHHDDVLDLAWSPDGTALLSGSVENECMIFDVDAKKLAVSAAALIPQLFCSLNTLK